MVFALKKAKHQNKFATNEMQNRRSRHARQHRTFSGIVTTGAKNLRNRWD
jgi:hypothetical protein